MLHSHHLLRRKRKARGLEPYPATTEWKRLIDKVVYLAGIVGPIMSIPQILEIYVGQNAAGVSPISWFSWALFNIPWVMYGFAHREYPIVLAYSLWFLVNITIGIGAVIYG